MGTALLLGILASVLTVLAVVDLASEREEPGGLLRSWPGQHFLRAERLGELTARLGLEDRVARAGYAGRIEVPALLATKAATALAGLLAGVAAAPAAPGRLAWLVSFGMPVAGFMAPDAILEREARRRLGQLRSALPDALDLVAVSAAAGRTPMAAFAELARGEGPLATELGAAVAEVGCGCSQRSALADLRDRVPGQEMAMVCAAIERSQRHGSPLADQLRRQAGTLRVRERRRIEERAAKAAPKIQLVVALLLVPSVLLMIAAALLVNVDRFLVGF